MILFRLFLDYTIFPAFYVAITDGPPFRFLLLLASSSVFNLLTIPVTLVHLIDYSLDDGLSSSLLCVYTIDVE